MYGRVVKETWKTESSIAEARFACLGRTKACKGSDGEKKSDKEESRCVAVHDAGKLGGCWLSDQRPAWRCCSTRWESEVDDDRVSEVAGAAVGVDIGGKTGGGRGLGSVYVSCGRWCGSTLLHFKLVCIDFHESTMAKKIKSYLMATKNVIKNIPQITLSKNFHKNRNKLCFEAVVPLPQEMWLELPPTFC